jgi:ABC-2 type transport system ATP-binding protein
MAEEALVAEEVRKRYVSRGAPPTDALRGVSLRIDKGERVGLLGRNGAGKTTFLRIASTLLEPTSGSVRVFGRDAIADPDSVRSLLAVVPQEGKPFFHLTPREQVYSYLRARGFTKETARFRSEEALAQMGLGEIADRLSITLSGGQRQRTMVATVIATEAPLMFLDEPTIGMDPFARREVWESLRKLTAKGCTILLTTHYLDEAENLAQRLSVIERGRVLVEGTGESLKKRAGGTIRVSITGGAKLGPELESFGLLIPDGSELHVVTSPEKVQELLGLAVRAGLPASVGPVTLEEAFLRVVGRSIDEEG